MIDKKKIRSISRREFIGKAAAAAAFTIVPRYVLGGNGYTAPSDKLNMACIGVGGMGYNDTVGVNSENIYALCDIGYDGAMSLESVFRPKEGDFEDGFKASIAKFKQLYS